jgi:hypothetical protein
MSNDPYAVLQVDSSADLEAIRAAYRRLARLYHPDRNPRPEAAARMRAINAAYALLSDPGRRAAHDARRYLPRVQRVATVSPRPPREQVVVVAQPPTALQRRVDRVVAVLGVLLLLGIGFYVVNVIPYAEQQFQAERQYRPAPLAGPAVTAQTAARAPGEAHALGAGLPERLRSDSGLRSFPGTVLVAPPTLEPFAWLQVSRMESTGLGIARYAVYYGDLSTGGATISGLVGRTSFDGGAPRLADCAASATYCVGPAPGQAAGGAPPGVELFRASDLVEDFPAYAIHRVCCNGTFWSVSWYEPHANMSYTLDLSRSVAARYGSPTADADLSAARAVAALASKLVRLQ